MMFLERIQLLPITRCRQDDHYLFQFCAEKGGYLAEIKSFEEQNRLQQILSTHASYWIGLSDRAREGQFVWQHSREPMHWNYWFANQPDDGHGQGCEDCVEFLMSHGTWGIPSGTWGWNDQDCNSRSSWSENRPTYALCEAN